MFLKTWVSDAQYMYHDIPYTETDPILGDGHM
jgi:hypothetical protein